MSLPPAPPDALLKETTRAVSLLGNGISKYVVWQLPQCNITNNPYSYGGYTGVTGTFGLFNCIAIQNGATSAVVWFYEPPGGYGVILSFESFQYPTIGSSGWNPWLYIGMDGNLYTGDVPGWIGLGVSAPISPGWHMAVVEEWASSYTGPFYLALYLDGKFIGQAQSQPVGFPQLFGFQTFPYSDIGAGDVNCWPGYPCNNIIYWTFFNGAISYIALYNRVLSPGEVAAIYQGCEITNGLVAKYTGDSYNPSTGTWVDTVNGYNATLVTTGYMPDVVNLLSLMNCPTCPPPAPSQAFPPIVSPTQPFVPPPRPP